MAATAISVKDVDTAVMTHSIDTNVPSAEQLAQAMLHTVPELFPTQNSQNTLLSFALFQFSFLHSKKI